jgi:hypothetical protein
MREARRVANAGRGEGGPLFVKTTPCKVEFRPRTIALPVRGGVEGRSTGQEPAGARSGMASVSCNRCPGFRLAHPDCLLSAEVRQFSRFGNTCRAVQRSRVSHQLPAFEIVEQFWCTIPVQDHPYTATYGFRPTARSIDSQGCASQGADIGRSHNVSHCTSSRL